MRFVTRKPREGVNVSDLHPLVEAGSLILGLSAIFAGGALAWVFFVDAALTFVSAETEVKLFSIWTPDDLVPIAEGDDRVGETRELLDRLARHWPDSPYPFRLKISESEISNAAALPGGLIVVTTALLDIVESENELAFVLGHELGHFSNRDHLRSLGRGVVLSIVLATLSNNEGSTDLGLTIADLTLRGFSREQESAADRFGLEIVYAEYGHIDESWRFFDRITDDDPGASALATYVSTHPAAEDRIEELTTYAETRDWSLTGALSPLKW